MTRTIESSYAHLTILQEGTGAVAASASRKAIRSQTDCALVMAPYTICASNRKDHPVRKPTALLVALVGALLLIGIGIAIASEPKAADPDVPATPVITHDTRVANLAQPQLTPGAQTDRGFVVDNVLSVDGLDDIHYNLYVPEGNDKDEPVALFVTLPGEPGLYYHGAGENLNTEEYPFTAQEYDESIIIAAPQPSDWGQNSANQVIALTEYLIATYDIDPERVYLHGYSYGGETLSLVMGTKPELYSAALMCASQWNGDPVPLAAARVPIRISLGDADEFYSVEAARRFTEELRLLYRAQGLSEREIDRLVVLDVKDASYFQGSDEQHGSGSSLMANDSRIMGWLFRQ